MIPKRPYLLRAFYDWIVDNDMTPHIVVNALADEVEVPRKHVKDGQIVLNIRPGAVHDFIMDNTAVSFSARFGGVSYYIYCPIYAIEAIYAREAHAEGIGFAPDEYTAEGVTAGPAKKANLKPVLTAVSSSDSVDGADFDEDAADDDDTGVDQESGPAASDNGSDEPTGTKGKGKRKGGDSGKRPSLRVIK